MTAVIPSRFLFRWSWPVRRCEKIPYDGGQLLKLDESYRCLPLNEIDGEPGFAELRFAWNPGGFALSVEVRGKQEPLHCQAMTPTSSDGVMLWLDTRSTQTVHRATRYCHQFCFLPTGSGKKKDQASVTNLSMARGVEDRQIAS